MTFKSLLLTALSYRLFIYKSIGYLPTLALPKDVQENMPKWSKHFSLDLGLNTIMEKVFSVRKRENRAKDHSPNIKKIRKGRWDQIWRNFAKSGLAIFKRSCSTCKIFNLLWLSLNAIYATLKMAKNWTYNLAFWSHCARQKK